MPGILRNFTFRPSPACGSHTWVKTALRNCLQGLYTSINQPPNLLRHPTRNCP